MITPRVMPRQNSHSLISTFFLSWISITLSSIVSVQTNWKTLTGLVWPIRWTRSMA